MSLWHYTKMTVKEKNFILGPIAFSDVQKISSLIPEWPPTNLFTLINVFISVFLYCFGKEGERQAYVHNLTSTKELPFNPNLLVTISGLLVSVPCPRPALPPPSLQSSFSAIPTHSQCTHRQGFLHDSCCRVRFLGFKLDFGALWCIELGELVKICASARTQSGWLLLSTL